MHTSSMSHWSMPLRDDFNWGVFSKSDDRMVPNRNMDPLDRPLFFSEVTNDFTSAMPSRSSAADSTLWKEDDSYHLHIKNRSSSMVQGTQSHTSNNVSPIISDLDQTDTCSTLPSEDVSVLDYISESNNTDANMLYPATETSINESNALTCLESQQMKRDNELAYNEDIYSCWVDEEGELPWLSTMYDSKIASELCLQSPHYGFDTNANMEALAENFTDANCSLNNLQAGTENNNETSHYAYADCLYAEASTERNSAIMEEVPCNVSSKPVQNTEDCSLNGGGANILKSEKMQSPADNGTQVSTAQKILNSNFPTTETYSSAQNQQKKHFLGSSCYMQSLDQNSQLEFNQHMHQVPFKQTTSDIHFDEGTNQCTSYENVHCYEKIPDQPYSSQAIAPKQNIGTVYIEQNIPRRRKISETTNDTNMDDASLQNSVMHHSSKIVSCIQQLQNVMKQMDPKTKLCIRDSLYRLAKSASRRNGFANQNCNEAISESKGIHDTKTSKRPEEFVDVETSTNPLDRAVAYLLLHDPADSPKSTLPADSTRALNSKLMEFEDQMIFSGCSDMETDLP